MFGFCVLFGIVLKNSKTYLSGNYLYIFVFIKFDIYYLKIIYNLIKNEIKMHFHGQTFRDWAFARWKSRTLDHPSN